MTTVSPTLLSLPRRRFRAPDTYCTIRILRRACAQVSGITPGAPGPNPFLLSPFGFYINGQPYEENRVDASPVVGTAGSFVTLYKWRYRAS